MSVQRFKYADAPKSAQLTSTFRNDDRCYEVDVIIGEDYEEVAGETEKVFALSDFSDYDINNDPVTGNWVGMTCRDYGQSQFSDIVEMEPANK